MALSKKYNPKEVEPKWVERWEKEGTYKFNPKSKKPFYSIDTPPPTVSGKMHIGHAASYTQQDVIARFKRMRGYEVFYPFGTDDNGLATERLIEKIKGVKATKMRRDDFVKLCIDTLKEIRPSFVQDWKNIGMSCDFTLMYSTINDHCRRISQRSFIELYKAGREYQKEAPTIWCPNCQTAIAQVELEDKELDSEFVDVKFKLEDGNDLIISTTRPELFPACVAIFVNPNDKRYKSIVGKKAKVPLFDIWVPIMEDIHADPEKGTGAVMCCTFGDQTDIEWYKAHNLPLKMVITKDGHMNEKAGKYKGMAIKEARKEVIKDLEKEGLLVGKRKIKHVVNVHERCGTEIEIINSKQWFIKYLDLKDEFLRIGNEIEWHPEYMKVRYDNWIKGLRWDWCISRQRFFGVPFPLWYCKSCGAIKLAEIDELPVDPLFDKPKGKCEKCGGTEFIPEKDVLDTWATSSLTPQIAIELIDDEEVRKKLYPMDMRPNAHDIITFWLFNTVVKSYLHNNTKPWKVALISGHIQDEHGRKMSKSKGNVIAPQDMIEKYSADALRFFATNASLGEDMPFKEQELVRGTKFVVKLWNAARFIENHTIDGDKFDDNISDKWIRNRLYDVVKKVTSYLERYEYSKAKRTVVNFFWNEFADYYIEMTKYRLYGDNLASKNSAVKTLRDVFLDILKMSAIFVPFVTEEIYRNLYNSDESIHVQSWPEEKEAENKILSIGEELKEIISRVRQYKINNKMSLGAELDKVVIESPLDLDEDVIKGTLRIKSLELNKGDKLKVEII